MTTKIRVFKDNLPVRYLHQIPVGQVFARYDSFMNREQCEIFVRCKESMNKEEGMVQVFNFDRSCVSHWKGDHKVVILNAEIDVCPVKVIL